MELDWVQHRKIEELGSASASGGDLQFFQGSTLDQDDCHVM